MSKFSKMVGYLAAVFCLVAGLTGQAGAAPAEPPDQNALGSAGSSNRERIQAFADRMTKAGFRIDPGDYRIVTQRSDGLIVNVIQRKDSPKPAPVKVHRHRDGVARLQFGAERRPKPPASSFSVKEEGVTWYEPECAERWMVTEDDGTEIGWLDACWQWGTIEYPGQTKAHSAYKAYSTCKTQKVIGPPIYFTRCEEKTEPGAEYIPMGWDSWDPPDDALEGCGPYNASINAGPISVTVPIDVCSKVDSTKGEVAPTFGSAWTGEAYDSERDAAMLLTLNHDFTGAVGLYGWEEVSWRY